MTALESLKVIAPAPETPLMVSAVEWRQLENRWGFEFPNEFKELISTYGSGRFTDFFAIVHPFDPSNSVSYSEWIKLRLDGIRFAKNNYPKRAVPLPVHPEPEGLFPWGYTDNGDTMCWLVGRENSVWPIVCLDDGCSHEYDIFEMPLVNFIEGWLTNKFPVKSLTPPDFFPIREPVFIPRCK